LKLSGFVEMAGVSSWPKLQGSNVSGTHGSGGRRLRYIAKKV
jgi:hypothetical protein